MTKLMLNIVLVSAALLILVVHLSDENISHRDASLCLDIQAPKLQVTASVLRGREIKAI